MNPLIVFGIMAVWVVYDQLRNWDVVKELHRERKLNAILLRALAKISSLEKPKSPKK